MIRSPSCRERVEQYSTEASVYQEGKDRINIEIPGVSNANEILDELGQPGSLYPLFHRQTAKAKPIINLSALQEMLRKITSFSKSLEEMQKDGSIVLTGTDVKSAKAQTTENPTTKAKENIVSLTLTKGRNEEVCRCYEESLQSTREYRYLLLRDGAFVGVPNVQNRDYRWSLHRFQEI